MATYNLDLLITFLASLRTKPFVILTGMSWTWKTSLVEDFVEYLYPDNKPEYYEFVPVKPNWTDSSPLLGFYNPLMKNFIPWKLTKIITKSYWDKENPYFILLDEINLARVEYYLAELLSLMETIKNGESNFLPLFTFSDNEFDTTEEKERFIKKLYNTWLLIKEIWNWLFEAWYKISNNLFIIWTANIDETTYGFSNKVLDRCNVIEVENTLWNKEDKVELNKIKDVKKIKELLIKKPKLSKENLESLKEIISMYKINFWKLQNLYSHRVYNDILNYLDSVDKLNIEDKENTKNINKENYYLYPVLQKILPKIKWIWWEDSEAYEVLNAIKWELEKFKKNWNYKKLITKIEQMQKWDFITFWK